MKAWWLGPDTLPHGDGRKVRVGVTHKVKGKIELCVNGLHASVSPLDTLTYGAGRLYRVEMSGTIIKGDDKLVASERTYIGVVKNIDAVLRRFARLCALDVIHLWDAPDVVVRYLKTGDESLRDAAWDAAWAAAAWPAAWDAARAAADAAAWAAADTAAWAAARDAADAAADAAARAAALAAAWAASWDAADNASWDAAWAAAWDAARASAEAAARDAAWDARAAARNKQSKRLYRMLMKEVEHD